MTQTRQQPQSSNTVEVNAERVIAKLHSVIGSLHVELAKRETLNELLMARIQELEGGDKDAGVRSAGKHHGGAEGS